LPVRMRRIEPPNVFQVVAVLSPVGDSLGVLDIGEAGYRHLHPGQADTSLPCSWCELRVAVGKAGWFNRQVELAMDGA
jgi:hypothetical protein